MEQSEDNANLPSLRPLTYSFQNSAHTPNSEDETDSYLKHPQWTMLLVLAAVSTIAGSSIPAGYAIGVINAPADVIKIFCVNSTSSHYGVDLTKVQLEILWSFVVSVFIIGGVIGSISGSWIADRVGRKGAIIIANILSIVAALFFVTCKYANSIEMLIIGRFLIGLSGGLTTSCMPMYLTEIAPINLRGSMGVMCPLGLTFGVLFSQIMGLEQLLGTETTWHFLLSFYVLLVICASIVIPFLPDSPTHLYVIKNQEDFAIQELRRLRNNSEHVISDIEVMQLAKQYHLESGGSWNMWKVIKEPTLRLPLSIVSSLQAGQQCSGINAVFYYSVDIFRSAGLSNLESQYANIGAGFVNFFVAILAIPIMSHFKRRSVILLSLLTAGIWLGLLTIFINFIDKVPAMAYMCIIAVLLYVFCYGLGLGPIPYFIGSELFDTGPRPAAMAIGSMFNWAGNFIVGMCFPSMKLAFEAYSFLFFMAVCFILAIFLYLYMPETKDCDIRNIVQLCSKGFNSHSIRQGIVKMVPSADENNIDNQDIIYEIKE